MAQRALGWLPDLPDIRDQDYPLKLTTDGTLARPVEDQVDWESICPPVYDQKWLGSCTAQAVCALVQFTWKEQAALRKRPIPARLFLYYNTRILHNTTKVDSGASLRNTFKALMRWYVCNENAWPHSLGKWDTKPSEAAYERARKAKLVGDLKYMAVHQSAEAFETALAARNPIALGFTVYENFDVGAEAGGVIQMPKGKDVGGHAVLIVGYNRRARLFKVRNSWGVKWGLNGYCWMPYEYLLNPKLARDAWTLVAAPEERAEVA